MRTLLEHLAEVPEEFATRATVESSGAEDRKAVYLVKRLLEETDDLRSFSYTGRRGKDPARGNFEFSSRSRFEEALEEAREATGRDITA